MRKDIAEQLDGLIGKTKDSTERLNLVTEQAKLAIIRYIEWVSPHFGKDMQAGENPHMDLIGHMAPPILLDTYDAALLIGFKCDTLQKWRYRRRRELNWVKTEGNRGSVRYRLCDVLAYIERFLMFKDDDATAA